MFVFYLIKSDTGKQHDNLRSTLLPKKKRLRAFIDRISRNLDKTQQMEFKKIGYKEFNS